MSITMDAGLVGAIAEGVRSVSRLRDRDEIYAAAPEVAATLGFDRAIVSRIDDGVWVPISVHIPGNRHWADEVRDAGREMPPQLGVGLVEDDAVGTGRPVVVPRVAGNPRVNRAIAVASRSTAFVAAPILVAGRPAGFLHADRYWNRRPFGPAEAAGLQALSDAIGMTLRYADPAHTTNCRGDAPTFAEPLTRREAEVAALIAEGLANGDIARTLFVSEATVKTHVKHILRKTGADHRAALVAMLLRS